MKSTLISLALATIASAAPASYHAPVSKPKPVAKPQYSDGDILNYALTLEHLEDTFYREGVAQFTADDFVAAGFDADVYAKFQTIAADEATHVSFLTGALSAAGVQPVEECTYNFGYTDVAGFVATAAVLEGVGVSAYLGAAAKIATKGYLTAAGSILTIEARHTSYVRNALKEEPFPQPFDAPLTLNDVYTLAASFITACPSGNPVLPLKAFPSLKASSGTSPIVAGTKITLKTDLVTSRRLYAAFVTVTGPIFVATTKTSNGYVVTVPKGVAGQSYVLLSRSSTSITDAYISAGPAIVEVAGTTSTQ